MGEVISERLRFLRTHLSERLQQDLTPKSLAEELKTNPLKIFRMENGLHGNITTFSSLLLYYRSHGYNIDWILSGDNQLIPMMLSSGTELLDIATELGDFHKLLGEGYRRLSGKLAAIGYQVMEPDQGAVDSSEDDLPEPGGLFA